MNAEDLDTSPIATEAVDYQDWVLSETPAGQLLLAPSRAHRLRNEVLAGVGALVLLAIPLVILTPAGDFRPAILPLLLVMGFFGLGFVSVAQLGLLRRPACFDAARRVLSYGPAFQRQTCSFDDIRAVQLIRGAYVPGDESPGYQPYELNLVLTARSRINLSNNGSLPWTREAGGRIAEFLQVPLLDQIGQGAAPGTGADPARRKSGPSD